MHKVYSELGAPAMTRLSNFNSPLLLGFDHLEQILDQASKISGDGYPPYDIIQSGSDKLRIVVAVAGFNDEDLSVTLEMNQLHIHGHQVKNSNTVYLYRGIASRRFHRTFLLAENLEVKCASLADGLLNIDLIRPPQTKSVRTIKIHNTSNPVLKKVSKKEPAAN